GRSRPPAQAPASARVTAARARPRVQPAAHGRYCHSRLWLRPRVGATQPRAAAPSRRDSDPPLPALAPARGLAHAPEAQPSAAAVRRRPDAPDAAAAVRCAAQDAPAPARAALAAAPNVAPNQRSIRRTDRLAA